MCSEVASNLDISLLVSYLRIFIDDIVFIVFIDDNYVYLLFREQ